MRSAANFRNRVVRVRDGAEAQIVKGPVVEVDGIGALPVRGNAVAVFVHARRAEGDAQIAQTVFLGGRHQTVARLIVRTGFDSLRVLIIILRIERLVNEPVGGDQQAFFVGGRPPAGL